jgi:hypothetical protein
MSAKQRAQELYHRIHVLGLNKEMTAEEALEQVIYPEPKHVN